MQEVMTEPLFIMEIDAARTIKSLREHKGADGHLRGWHAEDPDDSYKYLAVINVPFEGVGLAPVTFVSKDAKHWVIGIYAERNGFPIDLKGLIELCQ